MSFTKQLLLELYKVATIDVQLSSEEQVLFNSICIQNGLHSDDLISLQKKRQNAELILPTTEEAKEEYLRKIIRLFVANGRIREEELSLYARIHIKLAPKSLNYTLLFKEVMDRYISAEEEKLLRFKNRLMADYKENVVDDENRMQSLPLYADVSKGLKNDCKSSVDIEGLKKNPRIIVFGCFKYTEAELRIFIEDEFDAKGIELDAHSILFAVDRDYSKIKKGFSAIASRITNKSFDYMIYGPHPHSMGCKSGQAKWEQTFSEDQYLIRGDYNSPPSKSKVLSFTKEFTDNWLEK